jgi:signal peptidase I
MKSKWISFGLIAGLYLLWVVWLGNYWWLLGVAVIFDMYISKKIHWAFWKKKNLPDGKQTKTVEWIDALIFAIIAATFIKMFFIEAYTIPTPSMERSMMVGDYLFVSKVAYGPRLPNTPLSFPFVHHTMPFTTTVKSFSTLLHEPYRRIKGFGEIKNNDVVVFNFPQGDTVALKVPEADYYQLIRENGRERVRTDKMNFGDIIYRPEDKRENYIKRCIAIAGDSLKIKDGQVFVNGKPAKDFEGMRYKYFASIKGESFSTSFLEKFDIVNDVVKADSGFILFLTNKQKEKLQGNSFIHSLSKISEPKENVDPALFPGDPLHGWNQDNYGPIWIPKRNASINLTRENLPVYQRVIEVYEHNNLQVKDGGRIFINGKETSTYTFKMNYYWMMGDNRYFSMDSRYWGFVPEDHVVGKASFVWLSLDKNKSFPFNIRWSRFLMKVK